VESFVDEDKQVNALKKIAKDPDAKRGPLDIKDFVL